MTVIRLRNSAADCTVEPSCTLSDGTVCAVVFAVENPAVSPSVRPYHYLISFREVFLGSRCEDDDFMNMDLDVS
jgi:hypothetical protein